ncbi:MAG: ChuX/HutX family heme-like substrate-binding protein, partial [Bacteroidota bacterium]
MKNANTLKKEILALKEANPKLRQRDLAHEVGISEAQLLSLNMDDGVTRLTGDWKNMLQMVHKIGRVMVLTRNEHAVHERKGVYDNVEFYSGPHNMGVAVNPDIDLRFFMNEWKYGFAVEMPRGNTKLYSYQFFNAEGEAVHKIYTTPQSNLDAYHQLITLFKSSKQTFLKEVEPTKPKEKNDRPDEEI